MKDGPKELFAKPTGEKASFRKEQIRITQEKNT